MNIYLYKKTHNKTGLKYLGKTTQQDPHKYKGSGLYWTNHIKKHGYDVTTEIIRECKNKEELRHWGKYYSNLWNVVESNEWANLKQEEGDGGDCGPEGRKKMSMTKQGSIPWNKGLVGVQTQTQETKDKRAESNRGKKRTDEFKEVMSKLNKGRKRTPEQNAYQSKLRKGKPLTDEHILKRTKSQTGLKRKIVTCPHCGTSGGQNGMSRYHFDHCKLQS